jgi:diguanylate cyclase (GGDEF)-like protein
MKGARVMAKKEFDTLTTQRGSLAKLAEAIATKTSAYLTITQGEGEGKRVKLGDVPVTLGRSADCDFRLANRAVSRLHCRVWRDSSGYWVRDLNSTNKTYLNDRPVVEARLKDGDFISVGGTVVQFTQEQDIDHQAQGEFFDILTQDPLTGVGQRRVFEQSLEQEIIRSARRGRTFVLAIVGVDEMSRLNREWGKHVGDEVLKQVAKALKAGLRAEDLIARHAGDQFSAMLPETTREEAEPLLNAVRSAVSNVEFFVQGQSRQVTVSIGAIEYSSEVRNAEDALDRAEKKQLAAREGGRNRVVF